MGGANVSDRGVLGAFSYYGFWGCFLVWGMVFAFLRLVYYSGCVGWLYLGFFWLAFHVRLTVGILDGFLDTDTGHIWEKGGKRAKEVSLGFGGVVLLFPVTWIPRVCVLFCAFPLGLGIFLLYQMLYLYQQWENEILAQRPLVSVHAEGRMADRVIRRLFTLAWVSSSFPFDPAPSARLSGGA